MAKLIKAEEEEYQAGNPDVRVELEHAGQTWSFTTERNGRIRVSVDGYEQVFATGIAGNVMVLGVLPKEAGRG